MHTSVEQNIQCSGDNMDEVMVDRVLQIANIMLERKLTVRAVSSIVGVSKSTVHKDMTERLMLVNHALYEEVSELLEYNKKVRHIRGGQSTKEKYAVMKEKGLNYKESQ